MPVQRAASVFSGIGFRDVNANSLTPKGTSTLSDVIQDESTASTQAPR
jgi:hypothetical protein